jgi:hypothetical protein
MTKPTYDKTNMLTILTLSFVWPLPSKSNYLNLLKLSLIYNSIHTYTKERMIKPTYFILLTLSLLCYFLYNLIHSWTREHLLQNRYDNETICDLDIWMTFTVKFKYEIEIDIVTNNTVLLECSLLQYSSCYILPLKCRA